MKVRMSTRARSMRSRAMTSATRPRPSRARQRVSSSRSRRRDKSGPVSPSGRASACRASRASQSGGGQIGGQLLFQVAKTRHTIPIRVSCDRPQAAQKPGELDARKIQGRRVLFGTPGFESFAATEPSRKFQRPASSWPRSPAPTPRARYSRTRWPWPRTPWPASSRRARRRPGPCCSNRGRTWAGA